MTSSVARQTAARLLRAQQVGGAPGELGASLATRGPYPARGGQRSGGGQKFRNEGQNPDGKGIRKGVGKNSNRQEETETKN